MILFAFIFALLLNQEPTGAPKFSLVKQIEKANNGFTTDRLGQVYVINDYRLTLYTKSGDSLREFNSRKYGNISFVDATDPYKILVFFKDYNLVLFLDNYLSENGSPIDLQELGYDQISFACQSREKGMWLFDPLRQKLLKLDSEFKVRDESINLGQWFGKSLQPDFMVEQNNQLYLKAEGSMDIYVFDHFGTYLKKIALKGTGPCQVLEGHINYVKDGQFCQYKISDLESKCQQLDQKTLKEARIEKGRLYLGNRSNIGIYSTN